MMGNNLVFQRLIIGLDLCMNESICQSGLGCVRFEVNIFKFDKDFPMNEEKREER